VRFKKTIATVVVAMSAALVGIQWYGCTPRRPLEELSRLGERLPRVTPSALPSLPELPTSADPTAMVAVPEAPAAPTTSASAAPPEPAPAASLALSEVLDRSACSTEVVKGLSEQIIAEEGCLRPNAFQRLPDKLAATTVEDVVFPYLAAPAHEALVAAIESARREPIKLNSMLRTIAQQYLLYHWYKRGRCHIKLAASPGSSNHQSGLAIDIQQPGRWKNRLSRFGFRWMGAKDKWHFDFVGRDPKEKAAVKRLSEVHAGLDVRAFQRLWNKNHPDESVGESGTFDERTEAALRRAPVGGFPQPITCAK
jgi:hypothetical protein